jgi:hypothetical protein
MVDVLAGKTHLKTLGCILPPDDSFIDDESVSHMADTLLQFCCQVRTFYTQT